MKRYQIVLRNDFDAIIGLSDFYDDKHGFITNAVYDWIRSEHITLAIGDTLSIEEVIEE